MDAQHTPGPWSVWPSLYEGMAATVVHDTEPLETIAEVRSYANAHLIAAAPELLEALEAVQLAATSHGGEHENDPAYLLTLIHNMASTTIAKARGQ